ncbi:MAG: PocR ligand-binding domain-containing protein [Terriglobales bacterium]
MKKSESSPENAITSESDPSIARKLRQFVSGCSVLAVGFGLWVLAGWTLHIQIIKSILPGQVAVGANTAVCFILIGFALWVLRKEQPSGAAAWRLAAKTAAILASLIGLLSFLESAFGWDLGIDQLLFVAGAEDMPGSVCPGLMSPITAWGFLLLGSTLLLLDATTTLGRWGSQLLPSGVVMAAMFGLLDFVLDANTTHTYISPATASILFLVAFGFVFSRTQWGLGELIASGGVGGTLARRLLPAAILAPLANGWLRWKGQSTGLYSDWTGVALMTVTSITLLAGLTVWTGFTADRCERERHLGQETVDRLASMVEYSNDAIIGKTTDGIITSWNPGAEAIYGYPAQEMIGQSISILIPQNRRTEFAAILEKIRQGQRISHYETEWLRKNRQTVFVSLSVSPVKDKTGKLVGVSTIARDVTERKRAEDKIRNLNQELEKRVQERTAQLHESERSVRRKLESILSPEGSLEHLELADLLDIPAVQSLAEEFYELAHIPMFILDLNGNPVVAAGWQEICTKYHRANPEACKNCRESDRELSTGVAPGEFKLYKCKNNLWDVVTPLMVGGQQVGNLFTGQFFLTDETVDRATFRAQARKYGFDEQEYLTALDRVPRLSRAEVETGMAFYTRLAQLLSQLSYSGIKLARSASQIGRVNADLAASVKELEAFTYSVSHDLRAPLRHISGFSRILTEEFGSNLPPEAQHHVQRIQEGARRMGLLVDDLLDLARVGRRNLSLQDSGLKSVVDEVLADLGPECAGRQIEWKIGNLPFVECDPGLIKQVFHNLLSNAVKFTRPRPQAVIEVGQKLEEGTPLVFVRDNGVGFNMKYADKLFGVFQRLHRAEDFEGTGVGLATVQRIIQKHGGRIWAEADLDKGATFYFTLGSSEKAELKTKTAVAGDKA